MKRAALVVVGLVLVVLGLLVMAAGATTAALFGSDGALSTAPARVSGDGVALVIEDISIDASSIPVPEGVGTLTLTVSDPRGGTMFAGSAPGEFVDTYLTGAPYDVVVEVAAGSDGSTRSSTRSVPGTQQPPPPSTQTFWTRQATGSPAELTARVSADTTLVVMNSDATPGVSADLIVTLTVARAWTYAWIAVGVGVVVLLFGIVAFWRARVAGRHAREAAAAAAPPAPLVLATPGATVLPGGEQGLAPPIGPAPVIDAAPAAAPEAVATPATVASAAGVAVIDPGADEPRADSGSPTTAVDMSAPPADAAEVATEVAPADAGPVVDSAAAGAPVLATSASDVAAPDSASSDEPVFSELVEGEAADAILDEDVATGEPEADDPAAVGAAPVDMGALFAPAPDDDATTAMPPVTGVPSSAPVVAPDDAPDDDAAGPVAPTGTDQPAG